MVCHECTFCFLVSSGFWWHCVSRAKISDLKGMFWPPAELRNRKSGGY
ncbi:hypothetical protein KC19_2G132600 [Ceratodon purpureus]|uniref:Uncharacterized protein n=1 Tax=Ceratodon purpureus TaxID=3225 RepID=A0A8T0ITD2_CERPU|nr:hypothetical protein KC19_2G132600 [Ceratodon purpureus]